MGWLTSCEALEEVLEGPGYFPDWGEASELTWRVEEERAWSSCV